MHHSGMRIVVVLGAKSCLILLRPMDCRLPGSSVHGLLQARTLEWAAVSCCRGSSHPRDRAHISYVPCIGKWVFTTRENGEAFEEGAAAFFSVIKYFVRDQTMNQIINITCL